MNHYTLRRIAASASVALEAFGGKTDILPLLKALYLADREMLGDYGHTITCDTYVNMKNGPVLIGTYELLKGTALPVFQKCWDKAFHRDSNAVSTRGDVDTGTLSPAEEAVIKANAARIAELWKRGVNLSNWIHDRCPEWKDPHGSKTPLSIAEIASQLPAWKDADTSRLDADAAYTAELGTLNLRYPAGKSLLLKAAS
jgi:hypothetical protein